MHILLVEDDAVDVMNVRRAFIKNDIKSPLSVVSNGLEALNFLEDANQPHPDLILLDLKMPKMDGLEFLQQLRNHETFHSLPVFVLSTSGQPADIRAAYNLNVSGYIKKPMSIDNFQEIIRILKDFWTICEFP